MIKHSFRMLAVCTALLFTAPAMAETQAVVGEPAPEFSATDIQGNDFNLSEHRGDIVVLEWTNHKCPYVEKHYATGNMQDVQATVKEHGAKWVTIVSSAPGKQGHVSPEEAQTLLEESDAHPTVKILDESGDVGKMYGAQTTPHMFVIDAEGVLAYAGAIDDNSSAQHDTVEGAKNYVLAAVEDLKAGEAVEIASTAPYGCSVKY